MNIICKILELYFIFFFFFWIYIYFIEESVNILKHKDSFLWHDNLFLTLIDFLVGYVVLSCLLFPLYMIIEIADRICEWERR